MTFYLRPPDVCGGVSVLLKARWTTMTYSLTGVGLGQLLAVGLDEKRNIGTG